MEHIVQMYGEKNPSTGISKLIKLEQYYEVDRYMYMDELEISIQYLLPITKLICDVRRSCLVMKCKNRLRMQTGV